MILDIRKTETRLAPKIPTKGYYVDLTWERLAGAKQARREYTVGPFPEYARGLFVEFINLLGEVCLREGGASKYHEVPGYSKWFGQKPGDTPLGLVIETPHDDLDRDFEYELTGHWEYYCDGTSVSPQYVETLGLHPSDDREPPMSSFLLNMPQYHFERSVFVTAFTKILGPDLCEEVQDLCIETKMTSSFLLTNDGDERYIIHLPSGTVINWYKHLGRTNTCSKPGFGLDDLREMLLSLKEELSE